MTLDELIQALLDIRGRIPYSGDLSVYMETDTSQSLVRGLKVEDYGVALWDEVDPA